MTPSSDKMVIGSITQLTTAVLGSSANRLPVYCVAELKCMAGHKQKIDLSKDWTSMDIRCKKCGKPMVHMRWASI